MNKDYELLKSNVVECESGCFDEVKEPYLTQENEDESHLDDTDFDEEGLQ